MILLLDHETYPVTMRMPAQSNIVVNKDGIPGISELYYTDMLPRDKSSLAPRLSSTRWTAIELITGGETTFTKETDIWAFGMTIYVSPRVLVQLDCTNICFLSRNFYLERSLITTSNLKLEL